MANKQAHSGDQPLRESEEQAYHAFREWPVLLVMRQKELEAHRAILHSESVPEPEPESQSPADGERCPKCGGKMIERNTPKGIFTACENFPKCKSVPVRFTRVEKP